jgi:TrmH family RNA methyltransferase
MKNDVIKIESRQNPLISRYASLEKKKYRDEYRLFLLDGLKLFFEAVDSGVELEAVLVCEGSIAEQRLDEICEKVAARVYLLSGAAFDKISREKSPEGVICVAKYLDFFHKYIKIDRNRAEEYAGERLLLLSQIRDPGNLGTIIRSALALGLDRLILTNDCVDLYNSKTVRSAMGALFKLKIDVAEDFREAILSLRASGRRVLAAMPAQGNIILGEDAVSASDCIVIGNEGHGILPEYAQECDSAVIIPMAEGAESLNAAIAASIFMWVQKNS